MLQDEFLAIQKRNFQRNQRKLMLERFAKILDWLIIAAVVILLLLGAALIAR